MGRSEGRIDCDGVLQADEPEQRQGDGGRQREDDEVPTRQAEKVNVDAEHQDGQQGCADLEEEFDDRPHPVDVVEHHKRRDDGRR